MAEYTLSYSNSVEGWPSFYSFIPEWMLGLNSHFYSFNNGSLWRHNSDAVTRNNFYGVQYNTKVVLPFNQNPLENKLFKTLNLEGNDPWDALLTSDIQDSGYIEQEWFKKKEGSWFSFVRNSGTVPAGDDEYELRSANGLAKSSSIGGSSGAVVINFALSVNIGSIISVGDNLYNAVGPSYNTPLFAGQVTNIEVDKPNNINRITIDDTVSGATAPVNADDFYLYVKNAVAESHGILGHYCQVELENDSTTAIELFAVESEVMKSFP